MSATPTEQIVEHAHAEQACADTHHLWVAHMGLIRCHRCGINQRDRVDARELAARFTGLPAVEPTIRIDTQGNTWTEHHEPAPPPIPLAPLPAISTHHRLASLAAVVACLMRGVRRCVG